MNKFDSESARIAARVRKYARKTRKSTTGTQRKKGICSVRTISGGAVETKRSKH